MLERIEPKDGQLSVWDFPRPPKLEKIDSQLKVLCDGIVVAETARGIRVLEKYLAPSYYFPREDVESKYLQLVDHATFCRHTGTASYYDMLINDNLIDKPCWSYLDPNDPYKDIAGYIAFFPARVDACFVDNVEATSQQANYYGGWITPDIIGPYAGDEGMGF